MAELSELADELSEDQRYCRCISDDRDCASCRAIIALRKAEAALAEMRSALERAKQYLYNGFESDNQSSAYHDICAVLDRHLNATELK